MSPEKKKIIQFAIYSHLDSHLECLSGIFSSGKDDERNMQNTDETQFIRNFDNGDTLGFAGVNYVKYGDLFSGGERFTMMVRLSGGPNSQNRTSIYGINQQGPQLSNSQNS